MNKKGFTLVELIVVITILAILATVAFISLQGHALYSRDSVRLMDTKNMDKVIVFYHVTHSRYPEPDNITDVMYSGSIAWSQGYFSNSNTASISSMDTTPLDPITKTAYTYSVTDKRQEYSLATTLEGYTSYTNTSFANSELAKSYVTGNYNQKLLRVTDSVNNKIYLVSTPSIISSNLEVADLESIIENKYLLFNQYNNLPNSFSGSNYNALGGFDFGGSDYVNNNLLLFEGKNEDLQSTSVRNNIFNNLVESYSGSIISHTQNINTLLTIADSNNTNNVVNYLTSELNNNLGFKLVSDNLTGIVELD